MRNYYFTPEGKLRKDIPVEEFRQALSVENSLLWVDMEALEDSDIETLMDVFGLHPLTIEDCIMVNARPKVEDFQSYLFLVIQGVKAAIDTKKIEIFEVDFCLGKNYLITVHTDQVNPITLNLERVDKGSPVIARGSDFLMCSILESLADSYYPIVDQFDKRVDDMEAELFKDPTTKTFNQIYRLKNDTMFLRRSIGPQVDIFSVLTRGDFPLIRQANYVYFRNVYDHLVRINDIVGTSRDIVTGALEAYVSIVSNKLNEVIKVLTLLATVMMPFVVIPGIYGMNLKFLPFSQHESGLWFILAFTALLTVLTVLYLKKKNWL
ncbi:MAG: magnesium and cobalt transport protein CorA [Omnitrophica WOR_2 bacterium RIFCSPLOWO2_12_FULL_51_24]|nr:MAG: magnesium and cobalt transport protein CorA [Omnitrophica WOR_2 bacterium RIFCSPHIGHO2_01_FULL_49_10]OGX43107.1 MAG: magnesium and cobalt transport protein CorA [Omnitrophica WOR_2 bacterium RIFCSPLOWO2_12_FULL_51_24]